ncbi:MAG TPA: mechanosensitive ion channel family protein [Candidatus Caenarcaniphilales bacterium]|nr:mechanosensitive ion channel family protein [Candidatus Caenarcaniphilales bacterium]
MSELQRLLEVFDWNVVLETAFHLGLLLIATLLALRYANVTVNAALRRLFEREVEEGTAHDVSAIELQRRRETLDGLVNRALRVIILIIAFLMALQVLRLDIGPAIAGLGIVGLALSLGAQHLVRDYVAGAFVLIENQYSKGDLVRIAGVTGAVEDVSLRRTTLRDTDGTVHYVPHGLIQTSSNLTRTWAGIDLDVPVPYDEDLDRMIAAIDAAGRRLADDPQWRRRVVDPPRVARVDRLAEQGLVLKVVGSVAAPHRFIADGELRRLIIETCERDGLTLGWRPVKQATSGPTTEPASGTGSGRNS